MLHHDYLFIQELAHQQQRLEIRILHLQRKLNIAILNDAPFEVWANIKNAIEAITLKQKMVQTTTGNPYFNDDPTPTLAL